MQNPFIYDTIVTLILAQPSLIAQTEIKAKRLTVIGRAKMYHKTNKNKQNIFVRECIWAAIFALIKEKDFEKVTITEIIARAGVSRMGFYRNYDCKESVIEDFVLTQFENTVERIEEVRPLDFRTYNIIVTVLENFKLYADKINLLLDCNLDSLLFRCYKKAYYKLYAAQREGQAHYYYNEIFIANLFALECAWARSGMKESPDKLAKLYSKILVMQSKI